MKFSFFLIFLSLTPLLFQDSFAQETYRGETFTDIDYGNFTHKWTGGLSPWLETGTLDNQGRKIYQHYFVNDQPAYIEVANGEASFIFDKNTCSAKIYKSGFITDGNNFIVGSDSYVPKSSVNGSNTWSIVTSVDTAPCITQIIETPNSIEVSGTKTSAAGIFKIKYIKQVDKPLKTILEATNLSSLTDRQFGVTQTQSIPQIIIFGGVQRDLANHVNETFNRTFLENNKANLLEFSQGLKFDTIDAWNNLESIKVNSVSNGMASVSFNYLRNAPILLPNQTLMIDPTYGYVAESHYRYESTSTCNTFSGISGSVGGVTGSDNTFCYYQTSEFNIDPISNSATITNATIRYDIASAVSTPTLALIGLPSFPSVTSDSADFYNIKNSTRVYGNTTATIVANDYVIDLNNFANTDIQGNLTAGLFAIGWIKNPDIKENKYQEINGVELQITYVGGIDANFEVNDLIIENVGDAFSSTGNMTIFNGTLANVTSIVYSVNGTTITTNSTGQNTTSYPITINFGPFYYQQTTNSVYNHTVTVNVQDADGTHFNNTSTLVTREYGPNYFTALDPTQGLVNYTFVANNTINVNRDTSGSIFNIECAYYTQSQAFFNDIASATWDNKSNVIFYEGDTSGFYYIACFNDGELFVTALNQTFSNALVPGLVIFDQLGGFFGAPSIILVILAILSLGTGRNYPIIMLIAASVTGILLALELLVLDPGLVVVLIIMTGFGLFGIRKFY